MTEQRIVIVGAGLAGVSAAEELRARGFVGSIRLVGSERHLPYLRPPLSKGYMLGTDDRPSVFVQSPDWYSEHQIDVTTGVAVEAIGDHVVTLANGEVVPFDRLLLATGSNPRQLDLPRSDLTGIHAMRTIEDSETLREKLAVGDGDVVFVGAGWIGLELAAAARGFGNRVTVVGPEKVPLAGPLGEDLGTMFRELHEENGVIFRLETSVSGFTGRNGAVAGVETSSGMLPADLVVIGVGATPNTALARSAGIEIDNGIVVDATMATSAPDIYAAGDVANAYHPVIDQHMRNEHWATAIAGGKVAGVAMMGDDAVLDEIPYFYTDQFDLGMEYSGYPPLTSAAKIAYRGDRAGREFVAFWIADDRVVAGMNVNVWDVNEQVQSLIRSGTAVDVKRLTDESVPLAEA